MKSRRVLIGLFLATLLCSTGVVTAQTKANYHNDLIEIGPDNIAGRTRAVLIDQNSRTLYTGGVAGGLYKKVVNSASWELAAEPWEFVPCTIGGAQVTLPVTDLLQTSDGIIYIATGEGYVDHGVNDRVMAPKGRGLFTYNPATGAFALIAATNPQSNADWTYINRLACLERNGHTYFYAGTTKGLFRWDIASESDWSRATKVYDGPVQDIEIVSNDNMLFFTSGNKLFKIGNVTGASQPVDISSSNSSFSTAVRIELASAHSDRTYLYAMVADTLGVLNGVYLTHDQQSWIKLTTSTIAPFNAENNGWLNCAIAVDPTNHKRIFVGGATLWVGQGYVENSYYQWNKLSYSEAELNAGNYMGMVYPNGMFVHSGIHAITPFVMGQQLGYLLATDGGIFAGYGESSAFTSLNKGLNITQVVGLAVAPDGSVIAGAHDNSCPFIQSRMAHDGGDINNTWYDNSSRRNHMANILWNGNGGQVEASMFQQFKPQSRREIICSSEKGYGRAYADYADYTNTQTWTQASAFTSDKLAAPNAVAQSLLWETVNNTSFADSLTFTIDTLGVIYRNNEAMPINSNFQVRSGDQVIVPSPAHLNYPFRYTFDHNFTVKDEMQHRVLNPIANRMFVSGSRTNNKKGVFMTATPTDHRKVWSESEPNQSRMMIWNTLYECDYDYHTHAMAVSNDGDAIFINVVNDTTGESFIVRVYNITAANPNDIQLCNSQLEFCKDWDGMMRITLFDTILFNGSPWLHRPVTSMVFDPRANTDNLIITLGGFDTTGTPNIYYVKNANNKVSRNVSAKSLTHGASHFTADMPVYCALVEHTTGEVYVGTENGVFTASAASFNGTPSWQPYGAFDGVPVMQIRQQTRNLQSQSFETHTGINTERYVFAKTKYPNALYFATYGRGIFMDMKYVTDTVNEIVSEADYQGIRVAQTGNNSVKVYPNPAANVTVLDIAVADAGNAVVNIYDMNGRKVYSNNMGTLTEGAHQMKLDCTNYAPGVYLVNVNIGRNTATSKLIVK